MSELVEIIGGVPLRGEVQIGGAKNASLPLLIASLLTSEPCEFRNVPNLQDVNLTIRLLEHCGAEVSRDGGIIRVSAPKITAEEASYSLVKALRASFWVLAPLLARGGSARVALPGGDAIGTRPVDIHLAALTEMGADIKLSHGVVFAEAPRGLRPAKVHFRFPSVGATHQIMMAAALVGGTTVISGAAREPEIEALAAMLAGMGAEVVGAGTDTISITGRSDLGGTTVNLMGDRIEAGTYLLAGVATGGAVTAQGVVPAHFGTFLDILTDMGCDVSSTLNSVSVKRSGELKPVSVTTAPFPGFATDLQAPLMAALTVASGVSTIEEAIYEARFTHVSELCRMGAQISVSERTATITGVPRLNGAPVEGFDIRAAAALVIAGCAAEGRTTIHEPHHLRRGYEYLEEKITKLGGRIMKKKVDPEDFILSGC